MEKEEDLQVRHAMRGLAGKRKRHSGVMDMMDIEDDLENEDVRLHGSDADSDGKSEYPSKPSEHVRLDAMDAQANETSATVVSAPVVVGSALRRNEDGTVAAPIIRTRSKKVRARYLLVEDILTTIADRRWEMEKPVLPTTNSRR